MAEYSYAINVAALVRNLEQKSSPAICISKIHNEYVPRHIGLGLFHHSDPSKEIQQVKQQALNYTVNLIADMSEEALVRHVSDQLQNIKNCYGDSEQYFRGIDDLVQAKNFALDACFIIHFFTDNILMNDDIFRAFITDDIFMFQNQIPLFLLLEIMSLKYRSRQVAVEVFAVSLARYQPFQTLLPFAISPQGEITNFLRGELNKCYHLLHLLNKCINHFLSPKPDTYTPGGMTAPILCYHHLERLDAYRIYFKAGTREVLFKRKWTKSGTLHLPQISLDKTTAPLHRNLMNFARFIRHDKLICDLTFLMKCIVQERNESRFREAGIIQGDGDRFFERIPGLCDGVTSQAGRYEELIKELDEHCKSHFNRRVCNVRDFFCRHFTAAVAVAILGLVVAILASVASSVVGIMNLHKK